MERMHSLGIGLLTVPYALSRGGWLSLVFFFLIGIICFYTGILLRRCMDSDPSITSYLDIAERAYGTRGRILVMIIMNTELYLVAIGLLILEGDNLHKLFPKFMVMIGTFIVDGRQSFVIITALVIFPSMLLTDLSILSYVSATGVFSCLLILISTFCVGAFGGVGFHARGTLLHMGGIPTAISLYIVCFAGHPVIPSIYISMRDRYQFRKVLLFSFVVTTVTYLLMAIVGYLMYGDDVDSQITLNLPTKEVSANIAIYTTLLIPVTRYALMVTPVATAIEGGLSEDYKGRRTVKLLIRMALLVSTVIVAFVFPYFENLMAIVGSIFVVAASFVLPCLCYLKISGAYCSWSYKLITIAGIVVFGTVAGIVGTYSSIAEIVSDM
ncbi:Aa_trans domain-containing protein [Cephalotus follicularis]|uniref:Aa_trans domain-containing protein n=1 Tax=Cephalotus follicularis TaxID=3775 RepID=A0A1Q3B840_CEPFO|nr:Aa_trans domain-containing protein [Cephalotus follicularis]